jgi:hypothetical protein
MTTHLGPDDFTAALERTPEGPVAVHLAACAACRDELATLRAQWDELAAVDVPEPSPLFWDHFSARVRAATEHSGPVATPWPARLVWALGGAAAVIILVVGLRWSVWSQPESIVADSRAADTTIEAVVLDDVAGVFDRMEPDDVEALAPAGTGTWAMFDDLSDEERVAFVQLIEQQLEVLP